MGSLASALHLLHTRLRIPSACLDMSGQRGGTNRPRGRSRIRRPQARSSVAGQVGD